MRRSHFEHVNMKGKKAMKVAYMNIIKSYRGKTGLINN